MFVSSLKRNAGSPTVPLELRIPWAPIAPETSNLLVGEFVPTPNLLFALSQNNCELFSVGKPFAAAKKTEPVVPWCSPEIQDVPL